MSLCISYITFNGRLGVVYDTLRGDFNIYPIKHGVRLEEKLSESVGGRDSYAATVKLAEELAGRT